MAKPDQTYEFATDADATSDPGLTRRATGFVAGKRLPAKWLNWALNGAGKWAAYVSNLHGEPEFLGKVYHWTGLHKFQGGFQSTWPLGMAGAHNEVLYTDIDGNLTSRQRTIALPLASSFTSDLGAVGPAWNYAIAIGDPPQVGWVSIQDGSLHGEFALPHGAKLVQMQALVSVSAFSGSPPLLTMSLGIRDTDAPQETFFTTQRSDDGLLTHAGLEALPVLNGATQTVWLRFDGTGANHVHWVKVTFLDPGPRNY
jgi:hypothetical protein